MSCFARSPLIVIWKCQKSKIAHLAEMLIPKARRQSKTKKPLITSLCVSNKSSYVKRLSVGNRMDYAVEGKEQHKLGLFACLSTALRFILV